MPDYILYDVIVSLLTPVHIGSGRELLHEYDYAIRSGKTWRIDEGALLDAQDVSDPGLADQLARTPPAQLLNPSDFHPDSSFFRYVLAGTPRSTAKGAELREQVKDPYDRPFLPGSGLKGALRTALAWHGWQERGLRPDVRELGRRRQWAGEGYEKKLFGRDPNHDLLRALHVGDSEPVNTDNLMIVNARVLGRNGHLAAPIEMEALRPDTNFSLALKVDKVLFSAWAKKAGLKLSGESWLSNLAQVVQAHSLDRIRQEIDWYKQIGNATRLLQFYQQLGRARLGQNRFLIQLGWGGGWGDKTFGSRLQSDERFMERIIDDYRLAKGRRERGDPFPKSRRVAVAFMRDQYGQIEEIPATPLGWCLVEMKAR